MKRNHTLLISIVAAASLAAACQSLQSSPRVSLVRAWEHETSDIPVNPRIHFGKFNSGMRFAWMANSEPKDRCYVRLHVNVGSLAEEESERGMAHYLEHMCFNGSTHFPAGTLVEWFQKHGMSFGADTNASTGFDQTIYQLDLPNSDAKTIQEGLTVMRDFADGLLLAEKEVVSERGVIDAEERERDSAQFRVLIKSLAVELDGTRAASRLPIGDKAMRDKFTSDSIRKFYKKWYRPENYTLVVIGDLKNYNPESLVREAFGSLESPNAPFDLTPSVGECKYPTREFYIYDKELSSVNLSIGMARPWVERPENKKNIVEDIPLDFARRIVNLRFSELAKKKDAPFVNASAGDLRQISEQLGIRVQSGETLNIVAQTEQWQKALERCEKELRRAVEFGFDDSELNEVRANTLRSLDEAVEREKTRASGAFLNDILDASENRTVPADATTIRNLLKPAIEKLTVDACALAFKNAWSEGTSIVDGFGNIDLGPDGGKQLRSVFEESRKKEVKKREKKVELPFAYSSDAAKKGNITSKTQNADLDFTEIVFENKVRMRVKKTDFQKNQILINAQIGEGMLTLEKPELIYQIFTQAGFNGGGLGKHSIDDLRKINAGKQVGAALSPGDESFSIGGATTSKDLVRQFELMHALLTDPGWRDDGMQLLQKQVPLIYESFKHDVGRAMALRADADLYGDESKRFPAREAVEGFTLDMLKAWLVPNLDGAPIDITVIGDVEPDAAIEAAARTFGNLPPRRAVNHYDARRRPAQLAVGKKFTYEAESDIPKVMLRIIYPTTDGRDTPTRRNLNWVATILSDRLRVEVREKLGATYAPQAHAQMSRVYPGDGFIAIDAESAPDKVDETVEACIAAADGLAKNGATDDELTRAKEPILAQIRDAQRNNGFWMQNLSMIYTNPNAIADIKTISTFPENVKIADLTPLAKQYLTRDRATIFISKPSKPASAPANK
ncbi:MAG: insulinase family protein [Planctomycetes bacterium]|nr:insulinase family protein [Planctomycetota bacterium]